MEPHLSDSSTQYSLFPLAMTILCFCLVLLAGVRLFFHHILYKWNERLADSRGKLVVITGGTSGTGREKVWHYVLQGAAVVTLGRRTELIQEVVLPQLKRKLQTKISKLELSLADKQDAKETLSVRKEVSEIKAILKALNEGAFDQEGNFTSTCFMYRRCDLSDLKQVESFANFVRSLDTKIDLLFLNAGRIQWPFKQTVQGYEPCLGVNVIANFYLTDQLFQRLGEQTRVICYASVLSQVFHNSTKKLDLSQIFFIPSYDYIHFEAYAKSKVGVVLFAKGLQMVFDKKKINAKSVSLNPGAVMSDLIYHMHPVITFLYKRLYYIPWTFMRSTLLGAQTALFCANMDFEELQGGQYYDNCELAWRNKVANNEENVQIYFNSIKDRLVSKKYDVNWLHLE